MRYFPNSTKGLPHAEERRKARLEARTTAPPPIDSQALSCASYFFELKIIYPYGGDPEGATVSEGKTSLEFLAARVAALADRVHCLELRFSALEARFGALDGRLDAIEIRLGGLEKRFTVQEERTSRILAILVRLAERQGLSPE
jgi:hypothetical protein